jgi:spermidine/putrescine transport system ATP-binding protein
VDGLTESISKVIEENFSFTGGGSFVALRAVNAAVALKGVEKSFGSGAGIVRAVDGITLEVRAGEFFSLLGPSGCGKTTLLRLIAGFETADGGEIFVQGRSMAGVPPQKRPVNTVFQNYALFPHLDVFENVAFGLRMRKTEGAELARRVAEVMGLTHIAELRGRRPDQLSGGQKQRVALARALVNEPAVLLLDEPLAAIDAKLRGRLQADLRAVQRQLGTTFLYVTHDQDEALALSDRIAVLNHGKIVQLGTPQEIYERPRTKFVAEFLGGCNVFGGKMTTNGTLETAFGSLRVAETGRDTGWWGIRREDLVLLNEKGEVEENSVNGEIMDAAYTGAQIEYTLRVGNESVRALMPSHGVYWKRGDRVGIQFPAESILLLE